MSSIGARILLIFIAANFLTTPLILAQDPPQDKKVYVLTRAGIKRFNPLQGNIDVSFGESMPQEYIDAALDPVLTAQASALVPNSQVSVQLNAADWIVTAVRLVDNTAVNEAAGFTKTLRPVGVRRLNRQRLVLLEFNLVPDPVTGRMILSGEPPDRLDPEIHELRVRYNEDNFPSVVVGKPQKRGTSTVFTAAKGPDDADIYLSGSAAAARRSKPAYAIETKLGYLLSLKKYGSIGARGALKANEEPDIDPDSIKASGVYEYVIPTRGAALSGIILTSDFLGGEFDRKNKTRNFVTGADARWVSRTAELTETTFASIDFLTGIELGHNFRNPLRDEGIGYFWRPKFGATAYLLALEPPLLKRISFTAQYEVRLPQRAEIFSRMDSDNEVFSLTRKPRHYGAADLDLLFSDAYGFTIQYRYGSLPPLFKFAEPSVKLGFVLKLKQANR
jgi:hypothetical protein